MTGDIVERLRLLRSFASSDFQLLKEAADEIEQLRNPRDKPIEPWFGTCDWGDCNAPSVSTRWSDECGMWLPVCEQHRDSES